MNAAANAYVKLAAINVNEHVEKKGQLSYLSWVWAVDQLLRNDPTANWTFANPVAFGGDTLMVACTVTAFGMSRTAQLPVMDHRNKAISNPDAFAVNTAMQRCLVKAIALHGLGLYIYAGEDLPPEDQDARERYLQGLRDASLNGLDAMRAAWAAIPKEAHASLKGELDSLRKAATAADLKQDIPQ
jgi:hypothetical protein